MALYGILKSLNPRDNTGIDSELSNVFAAPLSITSKQMSFATDTVTLKRNGYRTEPQRWEVEAAISRIESSTNFLIRSVTAHTSDKFYIRMPQLPETFSFLENIPMVTTAAYSVMNSSINVIHPQLAGRSIPPGMFVQFAGHSKVYLVESCVSVGDINTLKLFPKLVKPVANGERLYYGAQVSLKVTFETSTRIGITFDDGILSNVTGVAMIEAL